MQIDNLRGSDLLVPRVKLYLSIIFVLIVIILILKPIFFIPAVATFILIVFYSLRQNHLRKLEIEKYIENLNFNIDSVTRDTLLNFPLPMVVVELDGIVIWYNNLFQDAVKSEKKLEKYIQDTLPDLEPTKLITTSKNISTNISINNKNYQILGNLVKLNNKNKKDHFILMIYFIENTNYIKLLENFNNKKPCVGIIVMDNYDDLMQSVEDGNRPIVLAEVDKKINSWFNFTGGIIRKYERDKYIFFFETQYLKQLEEKKFDVLDQIKEISAGNKIPVTLSIGIETEGESLNEMIKSALATIDLALGRGGDQVVIKRDSKYEFYGGRTKELEKRTRVKARVVAYALKELIAESDNIMIVGHQRGDIDSLGASLGLYRICKNLNKDAYIILNEINPTISTMYEKIEQEKEYNTVVIKRNEALDKISSKTLVIIVDTHRASFIECPELLKFTDRVVVIDHHRKGTDYIQDSVLSFHEIYASSTCELVTELLIYIQDKSALTWVEAEALYAGIMVDTKNFTFKTGVRTFEAAAFLKRQGVDTISVKQLFQNDLDTYAQRSEVVKNAEIIKDQIAISICPENIKNAHLITAQAADELLSISKVIASFVLCNINDTVAISGRSLGDINVQVILEKLGGGGHISVAGAQLPNISIEEAKEKLKVAIDEYYNNINEN